jgi:hypothetical protein
MNFLNPGLLGLLAPLLALPLLIHLFNRRFPHAIRFPDLERIRRSLSERSKLARWRHILMTVLRTLAILLALLAFLRPVIPKFGSTAQSGDAAGRTVLLVLDRSHSLEHQRGGGTSASRTALVEAGKILATLGARDRSNAILADARPELLLPEFTSSHDQIRATLAALPPSFEHADTSKAIALAATLLGETGTGVEVYFLSDFQRSNWADVDFETLPENARLFFVDTAGREERANTALLSVESSAPRVSVRDPIQLRIHGANWTPDAITLPVEAILDGRTSVAGEMTLDAWSTGGTTLEFLAPEHDGFHTVEVRTPDDALPADNRRYLRFEVRQREEVPVISDQPADEGGAVFVATALDPFEGNRSAFAPRRIPLAALTPARLASSSKMVLTGIGPLDRSAATRLVSFLENGGGLLYFLDGEHDGKNLQLLDEAAGRTIAPFHLAGRLTTENFGGEPQKVARGDFRSPFLQLFRGENRQALGLLEFYEVHRALPTGEGEVILSFADGSPAMGVSAVGLGTAIFCNFTPTELFSNLARQRVFPAWIQELVKNLAPDATPEDAPMVGGSIAATLWENAPIAGPDGKVLSADVTPDGERVQIAFEARQPGIYHLGDSTKWANVANINADETDLRAIDPAELTARTNAAPTRTGHFVLGADDYEELTTGRAVAKWFLLALAAALLVEMLLFRPFQRASGSA